MKSTMSILLVGCSVPSVNHLKDKSNLVKIFDKIHKIRIASKPLNVLYLASSIINSGHECDILDLQTCNEERREKILRRYVKKKDWVGFSFNTVNYYEVSQMVKICRDENPNVKVVFGGPHASFEYEEILKKGIADYVIRGEGERAIFELLSGKSEKYINNLVFKEGKSVKKNPIKAIKDLDSLPFPARFKLNPIDFEYLPRSSLLSSRGCPVGCTFCIAKKMFQSVRFRSAENTVDEIEIINNNGIKDIRFIDLNFSVNKKHVIETCNEIVNRKLYLNFGCNLHVDYVNKEILSNMKKAGFKNITVGLESLDEKTLYSFKKTKNAARYIERYKRIVKYCNKIGIRVDSFYIVPRDGDKKTILKELKFIKNLSRGYLFIHPITPFPGTGIWDEKENFTTNDLTKYDGHNQIMSSNTLNHKDVGEILKTGSSARFMLPSVLYCYMQNIKPLRRIYKLFS